MADRAVILLDVDGVLNPRIRPVSGELVVEVTPEVADRVRRLTALGEVVWATTHSARVRDALAESIGLPPSTRSVSFGTTPPRGERTLTPKRHGVDRWLERNAPDGGWHAAVWIDDALNSDVDEWAAALSHPLVPIRVDPDEGLTDAHVRAVKAALQ